jgi:hypothetical protein
MKIRPLDTLVFKGNDFVSTSITKIEKIAFGNGDWSHVGLVVTTDLIPIKNGVKGKLYVWESTMSGRLTDGVYNVETGKSKFGVQIRSLDEILASNTCKIGWCRLRKNPWKKPEVQHQLKLFKKKYGKASYEYSFFPLLKTIFSCIPKSKSTNHRFFCSELVATIYQLIGLIPSNVDPEQIAPVELLSYPKLLRKPVPLN